MEKTREELFSESGRLHKKLWESLPMGIVILNGEQIIYSNKKAQQILGLSPEQSGAKNKISVYDFISPDLKELFLARYKKALATEEGENAMEWPITNIQGEKRYIRTESTGIDFGGQRCAQVVFVDITSERNNQEAAKQSADQRDQILMNIDEVVYYVSFKNGGRHVEFVSPHIEQLIGVSPEDYKKNINKIISAVHPEDLSRLRDVANRLKTEQIPQNQTYRIRHQKSEQFIWLEEKVYPQFNEKGENIGLMGVTRDVTHRIEAEEMIRESEKKFRMLANNAQDVIYKFNFFPHAGFDFISQSIKDLTGYAPEEFYADPTIVYKIIHPDDFSLVKNSYDKIIKRDGLGAQMEEAITLRWIKKDGAAIWTETKNKPIYDDQGRVIAMEGITRDVTAAKVQEQALRESEEKFNLLSNTAPVGIFLCDENGNIYYGNKRFRDITGIPEKGVSQSEWKKLILRNEARQVVARIMDSVRKEESSYEEFKWREENGSRERWIRFTSKPIYKFDNSVSGWVGTLEDITESKLVENKIKESERTLSTLMNNLPGMAYRCMYDENWTMLFVSKGCKELTGHEPEDLILNSKKSFAELTHPDDKQVGWLQIRSAIKDHSSFEIEYRIIDADKNVRWVWEKGEGVYGDNGEFLFLEGFITDITERKSFEISQEETRKTYKNLIESSPEGLFVHDLEGRVLFANPKAVTLIGARNQDELIGHSVLEFSMPEHKLDYARRKEQLLAGKDVPYMESRVKKVDGTVFDVETKPILFDYFGAKAVLVFFRDLSYDRQLEKEQVRAQVAEEANVRLQMEIQERKNAERVLRETQKYTRLLIDSSLDMICASDKDGYLTEFNAAAQNTFGYKAEEVLGKHVGMLYANPKERTNIASKHLYKSGVYSGEVLNKKKNGELFSAYLSASVLRNDRGEIIGAMGVSRDITEIKKAEESLRQSEERYRAIYSQAFIGIALIDVPGRFLQVNSKMVEMFGYSEDELLKLNFRDITHPDDLKKGLEQRKKLLQGKIDNYSVEKRYLHKNGTLIHADLLVSLVRDGKGVPMYTVAVYEDITERKRTEEKIQKQASQLNAIIESSSHHIQTIDRNYCLTSFNQNQARWIKQIYGVDAHLGLNMTKGKMKTNKGTNEFWLQKFEQVFEGQSQHFEVETSDKLGNIYWREIYLNPIFGANGEVVEASMIAHDVTEKKTTEEKIRQSLKEKEVLLKEVHHRVKNNLQVITSILSLQSAYVKDQNTLNMLRESQDRIKSMAFIHESLYQTKDFSNVNFSEYVVNLSKNLVHSYEISEGRVNLKLQIDNVLLNLDQSIPCGLIINELVSNSLKYAFKKKKKGTILLTIKEKNDLVIMVVADDGAGIPKKVDFRKTESLGLQLVVTLVEQLNGTIKLDRKKGTKFTVTFKKQQKTHT